MRGVDTSTWYAQANTNNVNKTRALAQTTEGKDEPNIVLCGNGSGHQYIIPMRFINNYQEFYF